MAKLRADAREQHNEPERFADVIVGPGIEADHRVGVGIMGGENDDRAAIAVAAHPLDRLAPVEVGQPDVHDDEVRRLRLDRMKRRFRRLDRLDLKLGMQRELLDQRLTQVGVVIHDQQSPRLGHQPYFIERIPGR